MKVHHRLDGPSGAPPVVLVHELGAPLELWEPQLPVLASRFRVLRYDQRGHGRSDVPPGPFTLAALVDDLAALVLAGTIDGCIVGYTVAVTEELRTGDRLGVVTDVYVEQGAREVGVGEALLDQVVAWCEAAGCVGIDALALPGNRQTKNFFESFGFTARAIVVHRRLR